LKNIHQIEYILGCQVTTAPVNDCVNEIMAWLEDNGEVRYFSCTNPHSIDTARKDPIFAVALKNADILVPDGAGVVLASKILGGKIRGRITGSDIFIGLNERLNKESGYSCFFLGSTEKNLGLIKDKMRRDFPNIEVLGYG